MSIRFEQKSMDVDVFVDDRLFTTCVNNPDFKAPFMGPVYTSHGQSFTRPETRHREHPHQRSVFVGIGDINRYDFWNEHAIPLGLIRVTGVDLNKDENLVKTTALWQGRRGKKFLDEERTYKFTKLSDKVVRVDLSLKLTASYMDIRVGKTKEAGPLGIRVADGLRVDSGGRFENSEGGVNEEGCWGKTAAWCNYYGFLDGKKVGIAAYDHPDNERYPTAWHVRNYGLMALNNLYFKGGYKLKKGESIDYRFTLCFWEDDFDPNEIKL